MSRAKLGRWAVVVAVAAVLVAIPSVVGALGPRGGTVDASRLRALVLASDKAPYQGVARSVGSLALPQLPNLGELTALFAGTTSMRAWYAAPDRYRVATLTTAGERDVYKFPDAEYTWDYGAAMLTKLVGDPAVRLPRAGDLLPPELARRILRLAPGDAASALPGRRIAGVAASGLRITPADPATTIGRVDVWADPATGLPLQVEITARGQQAPIVTSEFQEVQQTAPVLTPPKPAPAAGFSVTSAPDLAQALGAFGRARLPDSLDGRRVRDARLGGIRGAALYGTGLASFAVVALPRDAGGELAEAATKAGARTTRPGSGEVVQLSITPLSLAVVRPQFGRRAYLLAGSVAPSVLTAAGAELAQPVRRVR
ncbi:hypothetical protein [Amycolatopsis sp. NPDC051903]|uniref:hypothetical protein n=1 Tax=Amycolatopsis sp. NPDC051903 TaxID=3363936 RepID=UPI00378C4C4D